MPGVCNIALDARLSAGLHKELLSIFCKATPMSETLHDIAQALFNEKGARLSVSEIARRAQVSRPTVYQQLGDKAAILARFTAAADGGAGTPQDLESRLMTAVRRVAGRRGFRAMTLDEVAEEAGIGLTTIFRRFKGKEDLIRAFASNNTPSRFISDESFASMAGLDGVERIATLLLTFMHENRDLVRLVLSGTEEDKRYLRGLREDSSSMSRRLKAFFQFQMDNGHLRTALDTEALAKNLVGMAYAQTVLGNQTGGFDLTASRAAIVEMFRPLFEGETP